MRPQHPSTPRRPHPATRPAHSPAAAHPARTGEPRTSGGMPLPRLNTLPAIEAEALLRRCCGSHRWAERIAEHRPYPDAESLLAAADEASYDLTQDELAEALAAESAHQPLTRHPQVDQPGVLAAHTALRAASAAYESRFGHAFVICLDGYRPGELLDQTLAGIRARLGHEVDEERAVTADEMRRIARGRLARLVSRGAEPRTAETPGITGPSVPD
ncbi:2-oxo-4-hydroxy-4-carboxy-5-ureidoimidazoline decarboxylase [Streptomyces sp. HNM0574]|nr:2-oxo-4-hydroxy-4-carboxy-5-ureidoimidazoline decarboxylase [Streptomyces sp. HNM0574]